MLCVFASFARTTQLQSNASLRISDAVGHAFSWWGAERRSCHSIGGASETVPSSPAES